MVALVVSAIRRFAHRRPSVRRGAAGVLVVAVVTTGAGLGCTGSDGSPGEEAPTVITVQGEDPARTNVPTADDPDAAGGRYLALDTAEEPPADGWYASYEVDVPADGVYHLEAIATAPMDQRHTENVGSYVSLAVGDRPFVEVAGSQPRWAASRSAWGDLSVLSLGDVHLERGVNALRFRVDQPTLAAGSPRYRWLLDELTLTRTELGLAHVRLGDPATNLGISRAGEPATLQLALDGPAAREMAVSYHVADYFGDEVVAGTATVRRGETTAAVEVGDLPPGNYRVTGSLESAPDDVVVGHFAVLPDQQPVPASANRFGVNTSAFAVVPPSRLEPFLAALRAMGAGYVRDADPAPPADPANATAEGPYDLLTQAYHDHGLQTLEFMLPAPSWDITETSAPLPDDLRAAYASARHLASKPDGRRSDAVQLWNEPDNDATASTGDQHAAYVKAAALGLADGTRPPLVVLSGIAGEDNGFQELMVRNGVARYADVWSFHTYAVDPDDPEFPGADEQHELWRRYGAGTDVWATESGMFLETGADLGELTAEQAATQARYLVQSAVEDLAAGTDRHFWFVGPPVYEDGIWWGLFDADFRPLPAYSAHAAMAALLGEANVVEQAVDEESGTARFVFDAGGHAVTVVWGASTDVEVPVPGRHVEVYDVMGRRTGTVEVGDAGTVEVAASGDPMYLVSDAAPQSAGSSTIPASHEGGGSGGERGLTPAERIVLSQRYDAGNQAPNKQDGDARPPLGYRLGRTTDMAVDVYNFGATPQTVRLAARPDDGWSVTATGDATVEVPPMGRASVPFTITADDGVVAGVDHRLVVDATAGDDAVPPSVARVQLAIVTPP